MSTLPWQAEWDGERGVLYLHSLTDGITDLRICGLPKMGGPVEGVLAKYQVDITVLQAKVTVTDR